MIIILEELLSVKSHLRIGAVVLCLPVNWTSCQFPRPKPGCRLSFVPVQGVKMNQLNDWTQDNWFSLGSLLTQFAFLIVGVWFARNLLRAMRAFQEQVGTLVKLSITGTPAERPTVEASPRHAAEASPYWLTPSETQSQPAQTVSVPEHAQDAPVHRVGAFRGLISWLREPVRPVEMFSGHRVPKHLPAPAGSRPE